MFNFKKQEKCLAINLVYNPSGGSLAQIIKFFENINNYEFKSFVVYITPNNLKLVKRLKSKNIKIRLSKFAGINLITRTIWEQFCLPVYLIIDKAQILFCPGNISPIISANKKAQWIGTIGPFEKEFVRIYSNYSLWKRFVLFINKVLMLYSSKTSNHIFFESFYTRDMFINRYNINANKTSVLHIGRDEYFTPSKSISSEQYSIILSKKFILSVSHLYPYKNIETLIHAFKRLRVIDNDLILVLAGSTDNIKYFNELKDLVNQYNLKDSIFFLGNLNRDDLRQFYSNCHILIFTSPFENFAYTLVEAMSCGAPIICSNTTAMPETCQDAAIYFNPYSVDELFDRSKPLLLDQHKRKSLIVKSLSRADELETYESINLKTNNILQSLI